MVTLIQRKLERAFRRENGCENSKRSRFRSVFCRRRRSMKAKFPLEEKGCSMLLFDNSDYSYANCENIYEPLPRLRRETLPRLGSENETLLRSDYDEDSMFLHRSWTVSVCKGEQLHRQIKEGAFCDNNILEQFSIPTSKYKAESTTLLLEDSCINAMTKGEDSTYRYDIVAKVKNDPLVRDGSDMSTDDHVLSRSNLIPSNENEDRLLRRRWFYSDVTETSVDKNGVKTTSFCHTLL